MQSNHFCEALYSSASFTTRPAVRTTRQGADNPLTPRPVSRFLPSFPAFIAVEIPPSAVRVCARTQLFGGERQQTGHGDRGGAHQAHEAGLYVSYSRASIADWLCVCGVVCGSLLLVLSTAAVVSAAIAANNSPRCCGGSAASCRRCCYS